MDQAITFDKNYQQRLTEYEAVLVNDFIPSSGIQKSWTAFLESSTTYLEECQALWKLSRLKCESLDIRFPTVVLAVVLKIDVNNLEASVKVIAVQDDLMIPENHVVPLIQLWPTKEQCERKRNENVCGIANDLDMLRFFYLHLYMPWDRDEEENINWKEHLERRLKFYYDLRDGSIPRFSAERIHTLLTEARRLHSRREVIEADEDMLDDDEQNEVHSALKIMHVRLLEIQSEIEMYEDPVARDCNIKKQMKLDVALTNKPKQIWAVAHTCLPVTLLAFMKEVKVVYPTEKLLVRADLAETLEIANANDTYLLSETEHVIRTTSAAEEGAVLKGTGKKSNVILTSLSDDVLDFIKGNLYLENLTLRGREPWKALFIRGGRTVLNNCHIVGEGSLSTQEGIVVLEGAKLEIVCCRVSGFDACIVGHHGSEIYVRNCDVRSCGLGIKLFGDCNVAIENTSFCDCAQFGIVVETGQGEGMTGDFDILKRIPGIKLLNVSGKGNSCANAGILQMSKYLFEDELNFELNYELAEWKSASEESVE